MSNSNLKIKELIEIIEEKLSVLKGKNPSKEGGISNLVNAVLQDVLDDYSIEISGCRLKRYVPVLRNSLYFMSIKPTYKADKRKRNGIGDYLEDVKVILEKNVPMELEVANISQWLAFDNAKENFERLEQEQKELLEVINNNFNSMRFFQDVMHDEAYDDATKKMVRNVEDTIDELVKSMKKINNG